MLNDFSVLNLIGIVCGLTSHTLENVLSFEDVASVILGILELLELSAL